VNVAAETPSEVAAQLADDARIALGRVRAAWPRLGDARLPGTRPPVVDRPIDPRGADRAAEQHRLDRQAAVEAYRHGRKVGGPHAAPCNLAPIDARHTVAGDLADLAARLWSAVYAGGLVLLLRDPAGREASVFCTWCQGTGEAQPPHGWPGDWPHSGLVPPAVGYGPANYIPPVTCSRCDRGRVPAAAGCQACQAPGPCSCDRADVVAALSMTTIAELLDAADVEAAADAEATLLDVADLAERVLRQAGPTRIRLPDAECPVCGARELHAEVSSPIRQEWAVRCTAAGCVCAGPERSDADGRKVPACPCGIATARRAGNPHAWPARTWDGPHGLAQRLGVALPGTEKYRGPRPRPIKKG
jgi:hypothetical protein